MGPYKASTLLDFEQGRPLELDSLFVEPLRQATQAGIEMPRLEALVRVLSHLVNKDFGEYRKRKSAAEADYSGALHTGHALAADYFGMFSGVETCDQILFCDYPILEGQRMVWKLISKHPVGVLPHHAPSHAGGKRSWLFNRWLIGLLHSVLLTFQR